MNRQEVYDNILSKFRKLTESYTYAVIDHPTLTEIENEIHLLCKEVESQYGIVIEPNGISIINGKLEISEPNILDPVEKLYIPLSTWVKEE